MACYVVWWLGSSSCVAFFFSGSGMVLWMRLAWGLFGVCFLFTSDFDVVFVVCVGCLVLMWGFWYVGFFWWICV